MITNENREQAVKQIQKMRSQVDYDMLALTVDSIVQMLRDEEIYIPEYRQRPEYKPRFAWTDKQRMAFLESVIIDLPIPALPTVFWAKIDIGKFEVVDGSQRIITLDAFLKDEIKLENLETLSALNGFRFSDLPPGESEKFLTRRLRIVILEKTSLETRLKIFTRINAGKKTLSDSEIRSLSFASPFIDFIKNCANELLDTLYRVDVEQPQQDGAEPQVQLELMRPPVVTKSSHTLSQGDVKPLQQDDAEELVTRFFAYSDRYLDFENPLDDFLNQYVRDHQNTFEQDRLKNEFRRMLNFVKKYFPADFGRTLRVAKHGGYMAFFEALTVGVNLALREKPALVPNSTTWLNGTEFENTLTSSSLPGRIEFVRDHLLERELYATSHCGF